jgi:tyrosinase
VSGTEAKASVTLDTAVQRKVTASFQAAPTAPRPAPDRIFLNLENVRGLNDAIAFNVYINVPEGDDPANHPELKAGSFALLGVRKATMTDAQHAGNGLTFVIEITDVIDRLHLAGALNTNELHVRLVPRQPVSDEAQIRIGRISVFRQSP